MEGNQDHHEDIKLMTFNLGMFGLEESKQPKKTLTKELETMISAHTLVFLQEVSKDVFENIRKMKNVKIETNSATECKSTVAIVYQKSVSLTVLSHGSDEKLNYIMVKVDFGKKNLGTWVCSNVHVKCRNAKNHREGIVAIQEKIKYEITKLVPNFQDYSILIMGDFNTSDRWQDMASADNEKQRPAGAKSLAILKDELDVEDIYPMRPKKCVEFTFEKTKNVSKTKRYDLILMSAKHYDRITNRETKEWPHFDHSSVRCTIKYKVDKKDHLTECTACLKKYTDDWIKVYPEIERSENKPIRYSMCKDCFEKEDLSVASAPNAYQLWTQKLQALTCVELRRRLTLRNIRVSTSLHKKDLIVALAKEYKARPSTLDFIF